ncbi:MAG: PilZ domain-containing protein [Myxococcota bacterium]
MASTARNLELPQASPIGLLDLLIRDSDLTGPNRRFIPRVSTAFIVRPLDGGPSYDGVDISFGGLMCAGAEPLWPGNVVDFDLILPSERQPVSVRARVVELVSYRGRVAMRMRFESLTAARRKRIALWMARRAGV